MIKHLFTLIWNRKRNNVLLIVEIFVSFVVLFCIFSMGMYYYNNYKKPLGFTYDNVWVLSMDWKALPNEEVKPILEQLLTTIQNAPEVENASCAGSSLPFSFSNNGSTIERPEKEGLAEFAELYHGGDDYGKVLDAPLVEGRWFEKADDAARLQPAVINQNLKERLFGSETALNKTIHLWGSDHRVVGVVAQFRKTDFEEPGNVVIKRDNIHWEGAWLPRMIILKAKEGIGVSFEQELVKEIGRLAPGWTLEFDTMTAMRDVKHKMTVVPLIALSLVAAFLILNVALGLFGVLWYNISKRISEIGLRRAVGSTSSGIKWQIVGEVMVLATFGLFIGCFFCLQLPILNAFGIQSSIYISAILISMAAIYLLVVVCALYPGAQAAKTAPAAALHEE